MEHSNCPNHILPNGSSKCLALKTVVQFTHPSPNHWESVMMQHPFRASSTIAQLLVWQCISQTIHALTVPWPYISAHVFALTPDCHTKRRSNASVGISKSISPRALSFNLPPPLNWTAFLMLILLVSRVLKTNKILLQPALSLVSS